MRLVLVAAMGAFIAVPALAHDFWVQPARYWVSPGQATPISLFVGHGSDRQLWDADIRRVSNVRGVGPSGSVNLGSGLVQGGTGTVSFATPGVHVVALQTSHARSNLPALRFNDYLVEEGLTPAIEARRRNGQTRVDGKEIYSRRAKALVRVGNAAGVGTAHVTAPLGMTLEIVPERDPYSVAAPQALPFRVEYKGRPLAGALVKLTNLGADAEPAATQVSNRAGRVAFTLPRSGRWQLNVVWTEPLSGNPDADFDTTFASLTFGFDAPPT